MSQLTVLGALARGLSQKATSPSLQSVESSRGWYPLVREPFAGAWQRNLEIRTETAVSNPVLFRCVSLISGDIGKMRCRLVAQQEGDIWREVENASFSPVLRRPNRYQTPAQFFRSWMHSKLTFGNAYILKARNNRGLDETQGNIIALYVLDPTRVQPLVAPDGAVFYQVSSDNLTGIQSQVTVPASEIIHDRWNTLFHPLVGLSPIYACGLAALQGTEIQKTSTLAFRNGSLPGGILTHPDFIDEEQAAQYKTRWEEKYGGNNQGSVAVLGNGLQYQQITMNPVDSQLIEQLKWSGETICGAFGVPAYKAGIGALPVSANVEALTQQYYGDALQPHIEDIEACLDEGLGIGRGEKKSGQVYGVEFDLDGLLRMDTATQVKTLTEGIKGALISPNEGRRKLNLPPVEGGESPMAQQQDFSLAALAERDRNKPFAKPDPPPAPEPSAEEPPEDEEPEAANDDGERAAAFLDGLRKGLA